LPTKLASARPSKPVWLLHSIGRNVVGASCTTHAEELRQAIEADDFFGGRFKGRVIRVDSATRGEESEEATARLLALEREDQTDVVIHVNKLKEGWDVRNLFTSSPFGLPRRIF
jgi:type III restriction enzyme